MDRPDLPAPQAGGTPPATVPVEGVMRVVRGRRVLLDADLAALYGVETRTLIQSVRRNRTRFPEDFMFRLTPEEAAGLRSQIVTSNRQGRGGRRSAPYVFTEQGVAMLSSVLRSPRAVLVNIEIMRAFVRLRRALVGHEDLARKVDALERKYDVRFRAVFDALRSLMDLPPRSRDRIGFRGPA